MIRYQRTKSSMFLMEIIINVLLFSILCVCSLQFFVKANQLTEKTTTLHHAVTACSNVASVYESGTGDIDIIYDTYPYSIYIDNKLVIFYDENYTECDREHAVYYILIEKTDSLVDKIHISFYQNDSESCYTVEACNYQPLTPATMEEVTIYE